ncbi:MAG: hypothetical protein M3P11_08275 [Actinomycetota bacterium]|nr:hypothetical protein [Actinomycetota bacterium]
MRNRSRSPISITMAVAAVMISVLAACGSGGSSGGSTSTSTSVATSPRPASTAHLSILSPANGQVIHGTTLTLKISLKGAKVVQPSNITNIVPDQGHLHVILDDQLVTMTAALEQTIPVTPGQHLLKVEFVANDHAPFDPRVIAAVSFQVKA